MKADFFFWSQLLHDVIDLRETREFIQNCTLLNLRNTSRNEVIPFRNNIVQTYSYHRLLQSLSPSESSSKNTNFITVLDLNFVSTLRGK